MAKKKKEYRMAGIYEEMEKHKPRYTAVAAFRHKPYGLDLEERKIENGKER